VKNGAVREWRDVVAVMGYLSQGDPRPHFGLGTATRADRVEIRWPDRSVQRLEKVRANQILKVVQDTR
jgi:hypothetical protein